eukprot:SAG31_NODE_212_length_20157_cov_9.648868_7_plen_64_part_00
MAAAADETGRTSTAMQLIVRRGRALPVRVFDMALYPRARVPRYLGTVLGRYRARGAMQWQQRV